MASRPAVLGQPQPSSFSSHSSASPPSFEPVRPLRSHVQTSSPADPELDAAPIVLASQRSRSLREVDASSILVPVISHTQSDALLEHAVSSRASPAASVTASSDDDEGLPVYDDTRGQSPDNRTPIGEPAPTFAPVHPGPVSAAIKSKEHHVVPHHLLHKKDKEKEKDKGGDGSGGGVFSFSLPKYQLPNIQLPKNVSFPSLPTFGGSSAGFSAKVEKKRRRAKTILLPPSMRNAETSSPPSSPLQDRSVNHENGRSKSRPVSYVDPDTLPPTTNRPKALRKSSSMGSLSQQSRSLSRVTSTTSTIGDDSQFMHIHSRPNVRFKAIKENFKAGLPSVSMPQLPQAFANFRFSDKDAVAVNGGQRLANDAVPSSGTGAKQKDKELSPALEALDTLSGDVVVLGGYRGSSLRELQPVNRKVWVPIKVGLGLRKVDLEVGLNPEDEESMAERIVPDGMLTHIGPVDISRRLLKRLRTNESFHSRRTHDWGYDWRLSPHLNSARLIQYLSSLPCNSPSTPPDRRGALVIAHSLGGLIVRHACNQRPDLFSGIVFAGSPQHCVNILGPLRNGDSVLFNSKIFTAQVNFTLRSSFIFLPESGECFVDKETGEKIPVDFFNVDEWRELGLSPCVSDIPVNAPSSYSSASNSALYVNSIRQTLKQATNPPPGPAPAQAEADRTLAPQMSARGGDEGNTNANVAATTATPFEHPAITLSKSACISYLTRTLRETLHFKLSLVYNPDLRGQYPPMAVLYSKSTPTVKGARVNGREGIKRDDCYEDLVFGAGDGVCLARAAMLPDGYECVKKVCVEKGHLGLLSDLEGLGECVRAVVRRRGW